MPIAASVLITVSLRFVTVMFDLNMLGSSVERLSAVPNFRPLAVGYHIYK